MRVWPARLFGCFPIRHLQGLVYVEALIATAVKILIGECFLPGRPNPKCLILSMTPNTKARMLITL